MDKAKNAADKVYTAFGITYATPAGNSSFVPIAAFTPPSGAGGLETDHYFFHPDHLGSSNYITNFAGEVSQHSEYFAFGETFIEEHKNSHNSPYKFNGKELDEESGLYYYGARYYDPRISIWASVDEKFEKYPFASPYNYYLQNPINAIDPDGRDIIVLRNSEGANGAGHGAILVGDNKKGWTYISKDGFSGSAFGSKPKYIVKKFDNIEQFLVSVHNFETNETHSTENGKEAKGLTYKLDKDGNKIQRYDQALYIPTTQSDGTSTDAKTIQSATNSAKYDYCL